MTGVFDPEKVIPHAEYTLQELARLAPYSVPSFRRAIASGDLKARKKGRTWLVQGKEFLRWWKQT